jgi:TPR repeat protein
VFDIASYAASLPRNHPIIAASCPLSGRGDGAEHHEEGQTKTRRTPRIRKPLTSWQNGEKLENEMLKECYSPIKRLLKDDILLIAKAADPLENQRCPAVPVRLILTVALFFHLLCAGKSWAQADNRVKAQTAVGYSIDFGTSVESRRGAMPVPASELKRSAESGDALAQNNLAYLYTFGLDEPQDYREAARWYASSAAQGFAAAQYNLGTLYERGLGVPRDLSKAARWYRAAAEQDHVLAQSRLGLMYESGWGLPKDSREAMHWYRVAADQGDRAAQCNLAYGYFSGRGVPRDLLEAAKWFGKAAEQGMPAAQNNLAALYHHGWGQAKDYQEALRWYRAAAEQGLAEAMNNLGVMYEDGLGVEKDCLQAAKWYRAAANQGDATGQYDLATLYAAGRGLPLDYVSAYVWYSLAASSGDERSIRRLESLSKLMTPRQLQQAQASLSAQKRPGEPIDEPEAAGLTATPLRNHR